LRTYKGKVDAAFDGKVEFSTMGIGPRHQGRFNTGRTLKPGATESGGTSVLLD
jgi:hypothetical protein